MLSGLKENSMTIAAACERAKRGLDFGEDSAVSTKKLRVLELHASNLPQHPAAAVLPGSTELNNASNESGKVPLIKKRSRLDGLDGGPSASPPFIGKRGKRTDGSSSSSAVAHDAEATIQAQMTCEGLEKDADLEAEQAYVSRRQQQQQSRQQEQLRASALASPSDAGGSRSAASGVSEVGDASLLQKDAAKGSRSRDQARHSTRANMDQQVHGQRSSSMNQVACNESPGVDEQQIHLDLVPDKEWQRLFAVLTISSQPKRAEDQQQLRPSAGAIGSSSSSSTASAMAAAAAPRTPVRMEGAQTTTAGSALTPTRRSFLTTEFCRVQARHQAGMHTSAASAATGM